MSTISIRPTREIDEEGIWPAVAVEISGTFRLKELKAVLRALVEAAEAARDRVKKETGG
jgi:hypothetical protein